MIITKEFRFEASHILPQHPGKCSRLHGHSWVLTVGISGVVSMATGFVMDFGDLKAIVQDQIIDKVDHQHLGYDSMHDAQNGETWRPPSIVSGVYPTSEMLVGVFAKILGPEFKKFDVQLALIKLEETCTSAAIWLAADAANVVEFI